MTVGSARITVCMLPWSAQVKVVTLRGRDLYPEIGAHVGCHSDKRHFSCPFVGLGVDNDTGGWFSTQVIGFYLSGLRSNYSIRPRINSEVFGYRYPALRVGIDRHLFRMPGSWCV